MSQTARAASSDSMGQGPVQAAAAPRRDPLFSANQGFAPAVIVALAGVLAFALPWLAQGAWPGWATVLAGAALVAAGGVLAVRAGLRTSGRRSSERALMRVLASEAQACYLADGSGRILARNAAADLASGSVSGAEGTIGGALGLVLADPNPVVARIALSAGRDGEAREDLLTRRGHLRLSAHRVDADRVLWRVGDAGERPVAGSARAADSLSLPMLTAAPGGTILFMNEAFKRLTGGRQRHVDRVFLDLPIASGRLHRVEGAAGPVECVVAQVACAGGRREIYLLPTDTAGSDPSAPPPGAPAAGQSTGANWSAVEDLPVPLLKVARTGEVLASNREARALLPMPIGPGTRLSDLLEGLGRSVIDWLGDVAEGRPTQGPQFLRGTGAHQDTFLRVALSLAGPPRDQHLIAVLSDMTEFKSLEAQFVQSQKMQAIGQLAGGVAHDFNNLLTAISGHCDLLLLRHDQADPDFADLIQISQNANRAASLVGQLLAFSRKQNLMPETLDLRDTLSDLMHLLNRLVGEKVRLSLHHDPALEHVRADKRQLEQVIMNLVVNARDAMRDGGVIRVETENRTLAEPMERDRATVPPGRYVIVRVIDQGTGIPPESLPKIFEPFYTTKRPGEGTGLGLSTAYGIVKQTGGFIFADSEVGRGTTFAIWLPSHERAPLPVAPAKAQPATSVRKEDGVVLLVEDEAPVRAFASRALRLRGYTVLEADSAEAALELLADPGVTVDIFVSDVIMPGKDGPTWVREALATRPDTKVVFVSGYAEEAFGEHKALIPNSVFLPKPFSLIDLTATVHAQLQPKD